MSSLRAIGGPVASAIALTVLFGSSATPAAGQCDAEGLENPYGNDPYGLVEWQGHYYDAGWFHLRRRAVGSGEWADFGGGISGGGAYTLTESMLPWNGRLVIGGVQYDLAVFEDGAWQGLGNANVNWPNDVSLASDGASLLVCGDFNMFNGVATGSLVRLDCGYSTPCPADLDGDGIVGASDLATVLARWGSTDVAADLDADGQVGPGDLAMMLASWNSCG